MDADFLDQFGDPGLSIIIDELRALRKELAEDAVNAYANATIKHDMLRRNWPDILDLTTDGMQLREGT